ncbi:hypothetical protein DL767_011080 [Monosporascus sp. MG133]|nr:hypothetical protein DL767_011080 [Monosporascus sp. MG133]
MPTAPTSTDVALLDAAAFPQEARDYSRARANIWSLRTVSISQCGEESAVLEVTAASPAPITNSDEPGSALHQKPV